jgi:hypothetical protein
MTQFYWPIPALRNRSVAAATAASGIVTPVWLTSTIYGFDGANFATVPLHSGLTPGTYGFSAAAQASSGANYFLEYQNYLLPYGNITVASGVVTATPGTPISLTANLTYLGLSLISNTPYWGDSSGRVFVETGGSTVEVTSNFGAQATSMATDGTHLYAPLPGTGLGILTLTSTTTATLNTVATPMTNPYLIAGTTGGVAVGGSSYSVVASGGTSLEESPAFPPNVAAFAATSANSLVLLTGDDPDLTLTFVASGVTNPTALTWTPSGEQILVSQTSANKVSVWMAEALTIALQQNLSVTGPADLAVSPQGDQALVCQPSSNLIQVLNNTVNVWSVGSTVAVTNPNAIAFISNVEAVCGNGSSISYIARTGSNWAVTSTVALGFVPTALEIGYNGNILAIGSAGGNGYLASIVGSTVTSVSWTGNASALYYVQGQIAVGDSTNTLIHWFDWLLNTQGTQTAPSGIEYIGFTQSSVWLCGSASIWQAQLGGPFSYIRRNVDTISTYISSAWSSVSLPCGHDLSALVWDGATLYAATEQNDLYTLIMSGATLTLTASENITVYSGQASGVTMGISSLLPSGSELYATTYASGVLIELL